MSIDFPKEVRQTLVTSIKRYFTENMDEEVGDLKASLLLDFITQEIGPTIYNRAIADAQTFLLQKADDLEGTLYEAEFGYWKK